jgi:16S rRNA (cytosine967-C5)-methyltransferase
VRAANGDDGIEALHAQNEPHEGTAFRVNAAIRGDAIPAGVTPPIDVPGAIVVEGSTAELSSQVNRGELVPQSLASQLVALAVDPQSGERVLDMCAAPGGKSTHLAALLGGDGTVLAVELHEHRADSVRALARRTATDSMIEVRVADATTLSPDDVGTFDRVLVDAPCTGTGVLGARPDARWKRTEEGIAELVDLQRRLLATAATLVRPGGVVVYSTCSILAEEDEQLVAGAPADLVPDPLPEAFAALLVEPHIARTWPHRHATDGFFIARFRRAGGDA